MNIKTEFKRRTWRSIAVELGSGRGKTIDLDGLCDAAQTRETAMYYRSALTLLKVLTGSSLLVF